MGKLEILRDVMAIIRDFLLIIVLLGLIVGTAILVLLLMNLMNAVQTQGLSGILPMMGSLVAGNIGQGSGSNYSSNYGSPAGVGKYEMDSKTEQIFNDIGGAMEKQDLLTVSSKIDELENHFKSKNMNDAADLAKKIKSAMLSGNMAAIQTYGAQLMGLFKQESSSYNYEIPRDDEKLELPGYQ